MMRQSSVKRQTKETQIEVELYLDGKGQYEIQTPVPFLNHMLEAFSKHGLFDLKIQAVGDVHIDFHHTVEDVGITLGEAFHSALGRKEGIHRYGHFTLPMDEVLSSAAIDFCGRPCLIYQTPLQGGSIGSFDVELVHEFFQGFTNAALVNLHLNTWYGRNKHHIIESLFKAFAKACDWATRLDSRVLGVPSTKGVL